MQQFSDPSRITVEGKPWWLFEDGALLPVVSGGDGNDGGDGGDGSDSGSGDGDGNDDGSGDGDGAGDGDDGDGSGDGEGAGADGDGSGSGSGNRSRSLEQLLAALPEADRAVVLGEVSKSRKEAKGLRKRLTDAAPKLKEYDDLVAASQTEAEKTATRLTAAEEKASAAHARIAGAEVKAALTGVVDDPAAIIEDLNLSRFVTEDGEPDEDAIAELREKYEAMNPSGPKVPKKNPAQGKNGGRETEKPITADDLKDMTAEEINKLRHDGKLDHLMGKVNNTK